MTNNKQFPNIKVDKTANGHRVFLLCSICSATLKEIFPKQEINVTRAYHCDKCDPNPDVITLNPPAPRKS